MPRISKRQKLISQNVELGKVYPINVAIEVLKSSPPVKFIESCDISVQLGIDPRNSNETVRGASVLPNGTGRTMRVAVFAQGDKAEAAKAAGADVIGFDDLAEDIKKGKMDFDILIATPDAMRIVGQLGQILGPRGLMPNPKVGTVTMDVAGAVKNAKSGQVQYRNEKAGIVHCTVGKINFESKALIENIKALLADLRKLRPASSKGVFLKKVTLSTTMGPGLVVDLASIESN